MTETRRYLSLAAAIFFAAASALAAPSVAASKEVATEPETSEFDLGPQGGTRDNAQTKVFAYFSDAELTRAAGDFDSLQADQRRALFTELRRRMSQRGQIRGGHIRVEQRFGSVARQPDGSLVRVEVTQRYTAPQPPKNQNDSGLVGDTLASERGGFGSVDAGKAAAVGKTPPGLKAGVVPHLNVSPVPPVTNSAPHERVPRLVPAADRSR